MSTKRVALAILITAPLTGCGAVVPEIQEFPSNSRQGELLVNDIVGNIKCEIAEAVNYVIDRDIALSYANGGRQSEWFDSWGIQTTLQLTRDETGSVAPSVNWIPPNPASAIFNLAAGGTFSTEADRIDKLNSFNTVQQFRHVTCTRPNGMYMLQSDLKLKEWLVDVILNANTNVISIPSDANGPFKNNVISHEIKFVVTTSGNLTPGWKLTRVSVNQTGNLFSANRIRTDDLTITLGPVTQAVVGEKRVVKNGHKAIVPIVEYEPSTQAAYAHLASQIGSAVAAELRGGSGD